MASLLVGACSRGGAQADLFEVRIGANLWMSYDLLSLAADVGWFEEEGVRVEIVDLGSLADSRAAFARGYVDGMATTLIEVVQARSEGDLNPVAVLFMDYSNGADVVVAKRTITSIAGLAGARIAVDPPLGIYVLTRLLTTAGMTLDDVKVVWASQQAIPGLAWSGQIDAAVAFPPVSTELTRDLGYNTLFSSREIPGEIMDVVSFDEQFLRDHPEAVRAVLRVWARTLRYLSEKPEEAVAAIAAREGLSTGEAEEALAGTQLLTLAEQAGLFPNQALTAACSRVADVLLGTGVIGRTDAAIGCASSEFVLDVLRAGL